MKKLFPFFVLLIVISSCTKSNNSNPATPSNPTTNYWAHYIPNWWNNDTLYGQIRDTNGNPIWYIDTASGLTHMKEDTLITKTINDTSFIVYKGVRYYVWSTAWSTLDTFKADQGTYINVCVNTSPDTVKMPIKLYLNNEASGYRYKDDHGNWVYHYQSLDINTNPKYDIFKAYLGLYISRTQHK